MTQTVGTIELVQFKLQDGISEKEGSEALEKLNDCIKDFEGFVSRKLSHDGKGNWLDLVYWTDRKLALKAGEQVMQNPVALEIFKVVDESSMTMNHYSPELEFQP